MKYIKMAYLMWMSGNGRYVVVSLTDIMVNDHSGPRPAAQDVGVPREASNSRGLTVHHSHTFHLFCVPQLYIMLN
jgi:hypothetical protein